MGKTIFLVGDEVSVGDNANRYLVIESNNGILLRPTLNNGKPDITVALRVRYLSEGEAGIDPISSEWKPRVIELEKQLNVAEDKAAYYQTELAKAHELLGRTVHQLSERWDSVRLTKYFPTDNLRSSRTTNNPKGK